MPTLSRTPITSVLCLGAVLFAIDARATTRYVGPFGYASLQAALDAAQEGDTISAFPGRYNESIAISKSVSIGKWPGQDGVLEIASPSPSVSTVRVTSSALTLTLSGLTLRGGYAAIQGPAIWLLTPVTQVPTVVLSNVVLLNPGPYGGVSGPMNLSAQGLDIYYSAGNGISITGNANLEDVYVYGSAGLGIAIRNSLTTPWYWVNRLQDVGSYSNQQGGLSISGDIGAHYAIDNSRFHDNTAFGVRVEHTHAVITNSGAARNKADASGAFGAGLLAISSGVSARSSSFDLNAFGLLGLGCADPSDPTVIGLENVQIYRNGINIDLERSGPTCHLRGSSIQNVGGTTCEDPNGSLVPCQALSSELVPPSL